MVRLNFWRRGATQAAGVVDTFGGGISKAMKAQVKQEMLRKRLDEIERFIVPTETNEVDEKGQPKLKETYASQIFRTEYVASMAHAELGDEFKISAKNQRAWRDLLELLEHYEDEFGADHPLTQELAKTVNTVARDFLYRSLKPRHTDVEIIVPSPEFFQPYWQRRKDTLTPSE